MNKTYKISLLFLVEILILASCATPAHRLDNFLAMHPELSQHDTVKRNDTVITANRYFDTAVLEQKLNDTFLFHEPNETVKIIKLHDTLKITANCPPDTFIKSVPVYINRNNKEVEPPKRDYADKAGSFLEKIFIWACLLIILLIILAAVRRK